MTVFPIPLDQVIHGLFLQQDQGGRLCLHHPGDNQVTLLTCSNNFEKFHHIRVWQLSRLPVPVQLGANICVKRQFDDDLLFIYLWA